MASLEISTTHTAGSSSIAAAEDDKEDKSAAASSIGTTLSSNADENDVDKVAQVQAKKSEEADKGKSRHQTKHGVMSLPAEIRETYAFQSST